MSQSLHLSSQMSFAIGQASQKGRKDANEDSIGIRIPEGSLLTTKGVVAAIADGVSAAEAGKEASELSVRNFLYDYYCTPESWSVKQSAQKVLTALNHWLYGQGQGYSNTQKGFVTTFSIAVFKSRTAHLFHVGDTRIFRIRGSEIEQLTRDHATRISENQTYLTRAMGLDVKVDIDHTTVELEIGDIFLLTTDGIHDYVDKSVLYYLVKNNANYEDACQQLISQAYNNNSPDNLSCQILRIEQLPNKNGEDVYSQLTELAFPPDLNIGMVLDGYLVTDIIHQSSRSQLYRVLDKESGERLDFCQTIHDVEGVVAEAARDGRKISGLDWYLSFEPCDHCANALVKVEASQVYFTRHSLRGRYYSTTGTERVIDAGIPLYFVKMPQDAK